MFHFFDKNFKEMDGFDWVEIDWNRKFYEPGSCMVYTTQDRFNPEIKFITQDGRPETGIVQKWVKEDKDGENMMAASGYFSEILASRAARMSPCYTTASTSFVNLQNFLTSTESTWTKVEWPFITPLIQDDRKSKVSMAQMSYEGGRSIGDYLYSFLKSSGKCSFWYEFKGNSASVLHIVDANAFLTPTKEIWFRKNLGSISELNFAVDQTDQFDHLYITQEVPEESGFTGMQSAVQSDGTTKYYIYEEYHTGKNQMETTEAMMEAVKVVKANISNIEIVSSNETAIREAMKQAAVLEALNHRELQKVDVSVLQNEYIYLKDYDLGNWVHVADDYSRNSTLWDGFLEEHLGSDRQAQIVEIAEVHKDNLMEATVSLGDTQRASGNIL